MGRDPFRILQSEAQLEPLSFRGLGNHAARLQPEMRRYLSGLQWRPEPVLTFCASSRHGSLEESCNEAAAGLHSCRPITSCSRSEANKDLGIGYRSSARLMAQSRPTNRSGL